MIDIRLSSVIGYSQTMRFLVLLLAALVLPAETLDVGPRVGDLLPSLHLSDQYGATRELGSLLGPKGAVIVLYRSADW